MSADETNQPNVGWDYGERWSGLPRISKCEWGWEVLEYDASMVSQTSDLNALDKDRFPRDVVRGCECNAKQGMVVLLGHRERTYCINPTPDDHGMTLTPRALLRISRLVHPHLLPQAPSDNVWQKMETFCVAVVGDVEAMRP